MALRKEPQRRYASVGQFAADIRRYLDGLPVIAHKDTFSYRTSKFVRRHRMGVVAAALVLVSLVGGILSTMRQAHRAERRFNDVRSLADSLLFEIIPKFYTVPGTAEAQEIATRRALQYLDTLSQEGGNDLKLKRELAIAYRAVADHMDDSMTNYPRLVETRQKIIDFEEKLAKSEPSDLHAQDELARDYERFAWTLWRNGDDAKGLEFYNKALAVRKALLTADNESFDFNYRLGHVEMSIGDLFSNGNKPREALQHYRTALSSLEKLRQHKDEPANRLRLQRALAYAHNGMAAALSRANDLEAASAEYARGWALIEPMMSNLTNDLVACELVTRNYLGQAKVDSKRADYQNARTKLRHAIEILETLPQSETQTRVTLADAYTDLGAVLYQSGDAAHAAEYLQKAIHIQEELSQSAGSRQLQNALATSYDLLAAARRKLTER